MSGTVGEARWFQIFQLATDVDPDVLYAAFTGKQIDVVGSDGSGSAVLFQIEICCRWSATGALTYGQMPLVTCWVMAGQAIVAPE